MTTLPPLLAQILREGVVHAPDGRTLPLQSNVLADEALFIAEVVHSLRPATTLEVGLAMGCSALAICGATEGVPGAKHIVIDPRQGAEPLWANIGLHHLERAGYRSRVEFIEQPSWRALTALANEGRRVQFAFIDGFHTFDYTLVDFFLIDRLLEVGGLVAFDDADWPSVRRVVRYVATNFAYSVHVAMPPRRERWGLARGAYEGTRAVAGAVLGAAAALPGVGRVVEAVFTPEWRGIDAKLGLGGPCVVLKKLANDARRYDHHVDF